jgi:ribonuclease BN (tRNA processing enzyme)
MTQLFFEMNKYDIDTRISNEGRVPLVPLVHAHELRTGGLVTSDDRMKVSAALVDHPPVVPSFAYRFDAPDRSIVISGDTAPSDDLVKLARDADVLVHSAMYPPAIDRLVERVPNAKRLKASILAHQTSAEDAPAAWPKRPASRHSCSRTWCPRTIPRLPTRCGRVLLASTSVGQ